MTNPLNLRYSKGVVDCADEHSHPFFRAVRVLMGFGFMFVGVEKFFRLNDFIDKVAAYRLPGLAYPYDEWVAYVVPCLEVVVGICLVFKKFYRPALLLQGLSLCFFGAAIVHLKMNFPEIRDCGCFPWENNFFPLHVGILSILIALVFTLWMEESRRRRRKFKSGKLKLP